MRVFSVGTGLGQLQQEKHTEVMPVALVMQATVSSVLRYPRDVLLTGSGTSCGWFLCCCTSGRMPQSTYRTWEALSILNKQTLFWKPSNIYPSRENSSKNPHVPITKLQNSSAFCHSYLSFLL